MTSIHSSTATPSPQQVSSPDKQQPQENELSRDIGSVKKILSTLQSTLRTVEASLPEVQARGELIAQRSIRQLVSQPTAEALSISTILSEAVKITAAAVSSLAVIVLQQSLFDPNFVNLSFYQQIRSGLFDQALAGGIIGVSVPLLYSGFRKVFCCNRNPTQVKIFQGATTVLAGTAIVGLGLTLSARALAKIDKAIALHEHGQREICKSNSKGFISETVRLVLEYFGPSSS